MAWFGSWHGCKHDHPSTEERESRSKEGTKGNCHITSKLSLFIEIVTTIALEKKLNASVVFCECREMMAGGLYYNYIYHSSSTRATKVSWDRECHI